MARPRVLQPIEFARMNDRQTSRLFAGRAGFHAIATTVVVEGQCPRAGRKGFRTAIYRWIEGRAGGRLPIGDVAIPAARCRHAGILLEESRENSVAWEFEHFLFLPACFLHYEFQAFLRVFQEPVARTDSSVSCAGF